jgi:hypothetical protein
MTKQTFLTKEIYELAKPHFYAIDSITQAGYKAKDTLYPILNANKDRINLELFQLAYGFPKNQFHAVKWVFITSNLEGLEKLVELTIASLYNSTAGYAYPTQATVARIAGVSPRTVSKAVKSMEESGRWLIKRTFKEGRSRSSHCYYLVPPFGFGRAMEFIANDQSQNDVHLQSAISGFLKKRVITKLRSPNNNLFMNYDHKHLSSYKKDGHYKELPHILEYDLQSRKAFTRLLTKV